MPYVINKTSGEPLLTLQDGILNNSTSIGLVGRNYVGYGEIQNENFIHLLENFANINAPARPLQGQNWYDTQNNLLKIYNGQNWDVVGSAILSQTAPEGTLKGALWLKSPENVLNVYDGNNWQSIGPETAQGFGITRARSTTLLDTESNLNPVILITINNEVICIVSQREFLISSQNAIDGFNRIFAGFNLKSTVKIHGELIGLASTASRLASTRTINGIGFNGETDIVVKSSTISKLKRGAYLTGSDFDGSTETTWSVDSSSSNLPGKIVVRDGAGGFSAGVINADFVGNLQGNVTATSGNSSFNTVTANQFIGANLTGNARTATRLQFDRKINGVVFNGTEDVTVTAAAATLTGNSLNPSVTLSNLSQVGVLNSLTTTDLGITVGNGGQLKFVIEGQSPTILNTGNNLPLRIRISDSSVQGSRIGIDIIPASLSLDNGGENKTSIIPSAPLNIGHPSYVINKVYANSFIGNLAGQSDTSIISTRSNNLSGGTAGSIPYQSAVNQTAFLPAGTAGQVLRSGGAGEPTWGSISFSVLERGQYLTGSNYDGFVSTQWSVDASTTNIADKVVARDSQGNFSAGTITANLTGSVNGNSATATRLQTPRTINGMTFDGTADITITALDPSKIARSGDSMSGFLTLSSNPVNAFHAATKQYVDSRIPVYTFTSGQVSCVGFTNQVGSFNDGSNYFDVFPPLGKTIADLVAFIPSLNTVHYAGGVNGDDSIRTQYQIQSDRVRVWVQNTEQRSTPRGNYLAVWS